MEEERTREDMVQELNELAEIEVTNLDPQEPDGGSDMLVGGLIGAGATLLVGGAIWLVGKVKKKHQKKKATKEDEFEEVIEDEPEEDNEPEQEPEKEEAPKKGK